MELYFECRHCSGSDVWRISIQGTRPNARAAIGDVECPVCRNSMVETGPCSCFGARKLSIPSS